MGKQPSARQQVIAVTGPDKRLRIGWWAIRFMLRLQGLQAIYLTADSPVLTEAIDGIVISGGDDIDPQHYGLTGDAGAVYDPERDRLELDMARRALAAGIPILGICRGAQLINVVLNGSLHQDIRPMRQHTPNRNSIFPIKWVDLIQDSKLAKYLNVDRLKVNSLHSQAIDRLGDDLTISARDKDDFIQTIEGQQGFLIGVQWHPEYMPYQREQRRLFALFAKAVRDSDKQLLPESN